MNIEDLKHDLQLALEIGWERIRFNSARHDVYAGLFTWLVENNFYESEFRNLIPNPAYDNAVKDLGLEFLKILNLYKLSIDQIFPGSFSQSREIENSTQDERIFELNVTKANRLFFKIKLRFPHSHEKFEFTEIPEIIVELTQSSSENSSIDMLAMKSEKIPYRLFKNNIILDEDDEKLILFSNINNEIVNYPSNKIWKTDCCAYIIILKNEHYNIVIMERDSGIEYYVNLSLPPIIEPGILKYVDMDIDISFNLKDNVIQVHDLEEFENHCLLYGYSDKTKNSVVDTLDYLQKKIKNKQYYFGIAFYNYCKTLHKCQQF